MGICAGVFGLCVLGDKAKDKYKEYRFNKLKQKQKKDPNVFWEFVKAKKQKYCPVIKFEGEKQ
ncbi:hypothetical protein POP12_102 [Pectobacterium phage POP12]|nr:hypothetical protein POP12_102 [Pectobacterium phage POP12]